MSEARYPGSLLVHPYPVLALMVVVVNDQVLKTRWPGLVTDKLSDFGGSFLLPVLLVSVIELGCLVRQRRRVLSTTGTSVVSFLVALGLVATKTSHFGSMVYGTMVGVVRTPFVGTYRRVDVVTDPTDLIALVSVLAAWVYCVRRSSHRVPTAGSSSPETSSKW